jgi:putative spermidine/putrescine transport system substrate-binding protein
MISTCLANIWRLESPPPGLVVWEGILRATHAIAAGAAVAGSLLLTVGCSSSGSSSSASSSSGTNWATVSSVSAGGGMTALVAAAKKEGQLNVITLPSNWANYGTIMKDFTAKYGIKINDANPDGSSQDELNAVNQLKSQSRAPDVLDMGTAFAVKGDQQGILAPYKVASWSSIPSDAKASDGTWFADYGGYVAIGYNSAKVKTPPTSFADLLKPEYKNQVAINGNPTQASAAFSAVYAAALASGGSLNNITPGIDYFKKLHSVGNFVPVTASAATMESGQTPIVVWWDYLLASEIGPTVKGLKIVIPSDASYAAYYDQAISKYAPDPAAARLWEEYLYSTTGQNLWLQGEARPIELPSLVKAGTVDQSAYKALPPAPAGNVTFPTESQQSAAENVVSQQWSSVIG